MVKNIFKFLTKFAGISLTTIAVIWTLIIDQTYVSVLLFISALIQISTHIRHRRILKETVKQLESYRAENIRLKQDQERTGW
jgi:hypothetical protein